MTGTKPTPQPLKLSIRIIITASITIACYFSILYLNYIWDGGDAGFSIWPKSYEVLLCIPLGYAIWKNLEGDANGFKVYSIIGGMILGGIGLILGIAIPLLMKMGPQGSLIGVILTGPIGFILGMVFGGLYWKKGRKANHQE